MSHATGYRSGYCHPGRPGLQTEDPHCKFRRGLSAAGRFSPEFLSSGRRPVPLVKGRFAVRWNERKLAGHMSAINGLNHLTLAVSDLDRSVVFYSELLGFSIRMRGRSSAYLEAGALWLALVVDTNVRQGPLKEYSHVAFSVPALEVPVLAARLTSAGVLCWQEAETAESFYFVDPDGHKLELHSGDLRSRLAARAALRDPAKTISESSKCFRL